MAWTAHKLAGRVRRRRTSSHAPISKRHPDLQARERLGVDHAIPLSDHADYDELFEAVQRVGPRVVYCTHGPKSFVDCLRAAGHNAHPLERPQREELQLARVQKRLF